tara:strand:+ start:2475 stop:3119 length:645 start_codon:yes stop_codon:yes gene_type:complete
MKKTEVRKEYKFIEDEQSKADHLFYIRNNYNTLYPSRNIQSLYLDTIDLRIYKDSLRNDIDKFKVRFRQYDKNKKITQEVKINSSSGRYKLVENTKYKSLSEINSYTHRGLSLYPVVTISFHREYYFLRNVRVTIDTNLKSKMNKFFNPVEPLYFSPKRIIEYKLKDSFNEKNNNITRKLFIDDSLSIEDKLYKGSESFSKYTYSISKLIQNND